MEQKECREAFEKIARGKKYDTEFLEDCYADVQTQRAFEIWQASLAVIRQHESEGVDGETVPVEIYDAACERAERYRKLWVAAHAHEQPQEDKIKDEPHRAAFFKAYTTWQRVKEDTQWDEKTLLSVACETYHLAYEKARNSKAQPDKAAAFTTKDGNPIFGEGSPHDVGQHLRDLVGQPDKAEVVDRAMASLRAVFDRRWKHTYVADGLVKELVEAALAALPPQRDDRGLVEAMKRLGTSPVTGRKRDWVPLAEVLALVEAAPANAGAV